MSKIFDQRINSWNLYVESTFGEYLKFAKKIINNNELQRKRVKTSKTIYSLLKNDLQKGCIMPPLVLALVKTDIIDVENPDQEKLLQYINENSKNVLLLDGLQRTYTLIDADTEMGKKSEEEYQKFLKNKLRLEIYVEINKFGILYRMLTLNTGQTPMSARHQLEMLYSDMLNTEFKGVKLVTDKDGKADSDENEFIFKNAIEGFNSYMNRKWLFSNYVEISGEDARILDDYCKKILQINGKKLSTTMAENLYSVRCLLVHNMYILNEESHKLLRELDNAFIDVLMDMLLTFDTKRGKEDIE